MLIDGEKWACGNSIETECCKTCIKGHRASHCKHSDRPLVLIKKKGRPSTQCKRCKELRVKRQLHVKCECVEQNNKILKKPTHPIHKKKSKSKILRPLAPKHQIIQSPSQVTLDPPSSTSSPSSSCCKSPVIPKSCCSKKPPEQDPLPDIPPPSSCCGPPAKNQQGQTIRVVTCRCGDDCACVGCDAHPARAMKHDVYIGFEQLYKGLSVADMCNVSEEESVEHPSAILLAQGMCGCGCSSSFENCSNCFNDLCGCTH